ncbi:aminoglycoside phosphotransferase family protein [Kribbella sp.]|uniref:aminoglycoside phosphotransferase family protein n=1 Tax=Kribbella sp. TaxID=1871183 RepID=UPI002D52BAF1|nr:aminoglycoside phosphotransferase family protein [Kribbella sp.]HZX07400.1 aminoglycoside phosphotransferase family protein [Kribbella sp.]
MSWQPSPDWTPLTAGTGQATGGVWRTPSAEVVKRLVPGVTDPRHHAYWERQALVAESGVVACTPGLRAPACTGVQRDADGITLRMAYTPPYDWSPEALAAALGRFAASSVAEPAWGARDVLRDRLRTVERRGGWAALGGLSTPAIAELWRRREAALDVLDALPRVPTHGDAHPVNLLGRDGDEVVAIDWEQFGLGPAGFDLGYLLLGTDAPLDAVVEDGAARCGAVLVAAYTGVSRAAWALGQPEPGDHVERLERLAPIVDEAVSHAS